MAEGQTGSWTDSVGKAALEWLCRSKQGADRMTVGTGKLGLAAVVPLWSLALAKCLLVAAMSAEVSRRLVPPLPARRVLELLVLGQWLSSALSLQCLCPVF